MASRLRFHTFDDLTLLREVVNLNPFKNPEDWKLIHENVGRLTGKTFTMRSLKDHLDHLLKLFSREDAANLKKSGTEEQYEEKHRLLQEIVELKREFLNTKIAQRELTDKRKGIQSRERATTAVTIPTYLEEIEENTTFIIEEIEDNNNESEISAPENTQHFLATNDPIFEDTPAIVQLEPKRASSAVLGPKRKRMKRKAARDDTFTFLNERREGEIRLRERELMLEERRLLLEESKLELEKEDKQHKRQQDQEELEYRRNMAQRQERLIELLLKQAFQK